MKDSVKERTIEFVKYKGISMKTFENKCGLSTGYVTSMRKGYGADKLNNVLNAFPELNRDWLLYGEGEMLRSATYTQNVDEGRNFTQTGNVTVNNSDVALLQAINEISEQRRMVQKAQEQIDRLLNLLERK
jgi:hypothetical protein